MYTIKGLAGTELTDRLSRFIWGTQYEDLPGEVVQFSKQLVLDTLGVAWAGAGAEGADVVRRILQAQAGTAESTMWVHGGRLPAASAALANSLFAAALDYDAFHQKGTLHSDIVVLPAGLAVAERESTTGKEFIAAMVAANEIVCRLGLSTQQRTGWFFTSVHGVFGAAAVAAKLLRCDAGVIRDALGLAYLNAAGTQQPAIERSISKRLTGAFAARSGVQAGLLAAAGYRGPRDVLEGRFGLYAMYEPGDVEALTRDLGKKFELMETTIKRYPCCACSHGAMDAALHLVRENNIMPESIEAVEVELSPYMARLVGAPFDPEGQPEVVAQFSVQYAVASAIQRRRFGLEDLEPSAVRDPLIEALAKQVRVKVDDTNTGVMVPVTVSIRERCGRSFSYTVTSIPGTPNLPLSNDELLGKFLTCVAAGPRPLNTNRAKTFAERVLNLEEITDMRGFFDGILAY